MTYKEASNLLDKAKHRYDGKPIANNTRLMDRGDHIAIRLHDTDIIDMYPDGRYVLRTGGWYIVTTKRRFKQYAPVSIWQEKHIWYLGDRGGKIPFRDGITIHPGGSVTYEMKLKPFPASGEVSDGSGYAD